MFPIYPEVLQVLLRDNLPPTAAQPTMASFNEPATPRFEVRPACPQNSPSQPRSGKRKRSLHPFHQESASGHYAPPKIKRPQHKGSFLDSLSFTRNSKQSAYEKLPDPDSTNMHREKPTNASRRDPNSMKAEHLSDVEDEAPSPARAQVRRKSSFATLMDFFTGRRKDSANTEQSSPIENEKEKWEHPSSKGNSNAPKELHRYQADMAPLAMEGYLRFENQSSEILSAGPSNFYQGEKFKNWPCTIESKSHDCDRYHAGKDSKRVGQPTRSQTPHKNVEAGPLNEGQSSSPQPKSTRQSSIIHFPNFLKLSKKRKRSDGEGKGKASSHAPAMQEQNSMFTSNPFLPRTLDDIGVLPTIETGSFGSTSPLPAENLTAEEISPTSTAAPAYPSLEDHRHLLGPALSITSPRSPLTCPHFSRPLDRVPMASPFSSTLSIPSIHLDTRSPPPAYSRPVSNHTQHTAIDDAANEEGLQLTRFHACSSILEDSVLNGLGIMNMDFTFSDL